MTYIWPLEIDYPPFLLKAKQKETSLSCREELQLAVKPYVGTIGIGTGILWNLSRHLKG